MSNLSAADILNPKKREKKRQRNYQAEYKRELKMMQMENRVIQESQKYEASRKPFQLKQFENVPSRVSPSKTSTPIKQKSSPPPRKKKVSSSPSSSSPNYVEQNKVEAGDSSIHTKTPTLEKRKTKVTPSKHKNYGKTPSYIVEREAQREATRLAKENAAKNRLPPGMRIMEEKERKDTLSLLNKKKLDIARQLAKLPLIIESPSLKRRQQSLEEQQDEIENAIETFSQDVIYVKE